MQHEIFKTSPQLEKVFVTTDAQVFYSKNDAENYAKNLEDKAVETVFNSAFLEAENLLGATGQEMAMAEFEAAEQNQEQTEAVPENEVKTPVIKLDKNKK